MNITLISSPFFAHIFSSSYFFCNLTSCWLIITCRRLKTNKPTQSSSRTTQNDTYHYCHAQVTPSRWASNSSCNPHRALYYMSFWELMEDLATLTEQRGEMFGWVLVPGCTILAYINTFSHYNTREAQSPHLIIDALMATLYIFFFWKLRAESKWQEFVK